MRYFIPQFNRGIAKTSFGKFKVLLWGTDMMTVSCFICRCLRSHGELSMMTVCCLFMQGPPGGVTSIGR